MPKPQLTPVEVYKRGVILWLRSKPDGVTRDELNEKFPEVRLIEMEKRDKTVEWVNDRWRIKQ